MTSTAFKDRRLEVVHQRLFDDHNLGTWAVLDGAAVQGLVRAIGTHEVPSACLFAGQLHPSMARVAPYLVELQEGSTFTEWLLERGWGRHWGIFLRSRGDLATLQKHLRGLLMVRDTAGKTMQFRYYDPRVLRVYLPTCNAEDMESLFGPVESYCVEAEGGNELLVFSPDASAPRLESVPLAEAQG